MKAWVIDKITDLSKENQPLKLVSLPEPQAKAGELLIKISTCGVCHTEIDEIEGRTPPPVYPIVAVHQVVGRMEEANQAIMDIKQRKIKSRKVLVIS